LEGLYRILLNIQICSVRTSEIVIIKK